MRLDVEIFGERQVSRELLRFGDRIEDARPAFRRIVEHLMDVEQRQFDTQGQYASGRWAPLKEETIRAKVNRGEDPRILRATEALMHSLTQRGAAGQKLIITPTEMVFGTTVPYAKFHQTGTSRMPQRRPVEHTERDRRELVRILQRHIVGAVKA